jgi:hypothetical protein
MTTNPVFNNFACPTEQDFYKDLYEEMPQIHGLDVTYVIQNKEHIHSTLNDVEYSTFETTHVIEAYIESIDGFDGEGEVLQKFGLEIRDQLILAISQDRFSTLGIGRPKEGDLIYFPFNKKIFEVRFVEHERPFYHFGKNYVYTITLEMFEYSGQTFKTGVTEIDKVQYDNAYSMNLTLGAGSGTYTVGETVYTGVDLASAVAQGMVASWDAGTSTLEVVDVIGKFVDTQNVIGDSSAASYVFDIADGKTYEDIELEFPNEDSDNLDFENDAKDVIDFSETNPFSESDF